MTVDKKSNYFPLPTTTFVLSKQQKTTLKYEKKINFFHKMRNLLFTVYIYLLFFFRLNGYLIWAAIKFGWFGTFTISSKTVHIKHNYCCFFACFICIFVFTSFFVFIWWFFVQKNATTYNMIVYFNDNSFL